MESNEVNSNSNNETVHPEVRAHINSLVSALGGASVEDDGRYKLGDDALEVLRDIKKWIRFYDEKTNRMDVARCLADSNIVGNDLLHIVALWTENDTNSKFKARTALACFEIMVPLTWPIEKDPETMTVNHHRHISVLQLAQLAYKRAIINFDGASILHTAIRVALPSMAIPIGDRTSRDQGIIKLVLFFLRNMAMISPPPGVKYDDDESQISRSATIDAFSYQDVFLALLTVASNMGEDFRTEDVIIMEIIYHLIKKVDSRKLFMNDQELSKARANELTAMLSKEKAMLRAHNKNAPTRHNRFGTMIWVKREDGKMSTVSGQEALLNPALRESKMDDSKTFRPPRRARKDGMEPKDLGLKPSLNARANDQLRSFVEDFLDSGFNPLFQHVRKSIDREAQHVVGYHRAQFFYLVAWFLEAERMRRKSKKDTKPTASASDVGSFNLVAGVLNQEMFITLNRSLDRTYNDKDWQELTTVMRCFTQILLTIQEMTESGNEEDEEIADNILSRLFYEDTVHDAVANIARTYKDQGFEYLDACTELVHNYLRILEAYSKQNVDLQVRSRKRTRKKKAAQAVEASTEENRDEGEESANDEADAERASRERKFDFKRFANRFIPQGVIDTFVRFTRYYRDLDDAQLKRAHRYFYRIAFKQEMSVMLFRVDIIHLFYGMIKGQEPLDKNSSMFKEWEELAKQIIKKCVRKIEERPALITELLFSKINSTAHYLEFGYEKQTISTNPRPGAELEFRGAVDHDQQIAIAVGVLLDKSQTDHLEWIKKQLHDCESERRAWEAADRARASMSGADRVPPTEEPLEPEVASLFTVHPDNDARRTAMFKNPHLRLLMKLVGMERIAPSHDETPESVWVIPGQVAAEALQNSLDLIKKAEFSPPTFDDGELAEDQLRRKSAARKRAVFDDDDDMSGLIDDGGVLFPAGTLEARKPDHERPKKGIRRRRRPDSDAEEPTEEQLDEKARARRQKELEKLRKIKSEMYVHASDDDTDDERDREFFESERRRQQTKDVTFGLSATPTLDTGKAMWEKILDVDDEDDDGDDQLASTQQEEKPKSRGHTASKKPRKRKSEPELESSDEEGEEPSARRLSKKRKPTKALVETDDEEPASSQTLGADGDADDTPLSSSPHPSAAKSDLAAVADKAHASPGDAIEVDDEDDDMPVAPPPKARVRVRAGFIVDSSDEE